MGALLAKLEEAQRLAAPALPALVQQVEPTSFPELEQHPASILRSAVDLTELFEQGEPPLDHQDTPRLGHRAFYRAGAHLLGGHPKEGKSWLLLLLILDYLRSNPEGVCVVWDFENGSRRFVRRLHQLAA